MLVEEHRLSVVKEASEDLVHKGCWKVLSKERTLSLFN